MIQSDQSISVSLEVVALQKRQAGIPLSRKLCYAVGGVPYQMTLNAKGLFMQIFLLDVVQVSDAPGCGGRCRHVL